LGDVRPRVKGRRKRSIINGYSSIKNDKQGINMKKKNSGTQAKSTLIVKPRVGIL